MARMAEAPRVVTEALVTLARVAKEVAASWAVVGGQALVAHGVPRDTLDLDVLVEREQLGALAVALVEAGWDALAFDRASGSYVRVPSPRAHYFDDPVLFDCAEERIMFPLRAPSGFDVDLLAAQHPVERAMIAEANQRKLYDASIPLAPLGGVMLVKVKADRTKDIGALEQSAEHLPRRTTEAAIEWARRFDPASADDLAAVLRAAQARKTPKRIDGEPTGKP